MENKKRYVAMTLVELLLYLALFAMIITVMVQFFLFVSEKNLDAKYRIDQSRNVIFLYEYFESYRKKTDLIDFNSSITDNSYGKLVFSQGVNIYEIYREGDNLYFKDSLGSVQLNAKHINITDFSLFKILNEKGVPVGIKISMNIRYTLGNVETTNFEFIFKP